MRSGFLLAVGHTLKKKVSTVDPLEFDAFDSVDLAADPTFAPAVILLLISGLVFWIWNRDS